MSIVIASLYNYTLYRYIRTTLYRYIKIADHVRMFNSLQVK